MDSLIDSVQSNNNIVLLLVSMAVVYVYMNPNSYMDVLNFAQSNMYMIAGVAFLMVLLNSQNNSLEYVSEDGDLLVPCDPDDIDEDCEWMEEVDTDEDEIEEFARKRSKSAHKKDKPRKYRKCKSAKSSRTGKCRLMMKKKKRKIIRTKR